MVTYGSTDKERNRLLPISLSFQPSNKHALFSYKEETPSKVGYVYYHGVSHAFVYSAVRSFGKNRLGLSFHSVLRVLTLIY
jgi:hypothetical protein